MKISLWKVTWRTFVVALFLIFPFILSSETRSKKAKPAHPAKESVKEGQKVFQSNCAICHRADDTKGKIGPGLIGLFKNKELPNSHKPATESNIREQIEKGMPNAKPMPMPAFGEKLSLKEIQDLLAYLKTL